MKNTLFSLFFIIAFGCQAEEFSMQENQVQVNSDVAILSYKDIEERVDVFIQNTEDSEEMTSVLCELCNDGNDCTNDYCLPQGGCDHIQNMASCEDENACTEKTLCHNGACVVAKMLECSSPVGTTCIEAYCHQKEGCKLSLKEKCITCEVPDGSAGTTGGFCEVEGTCLKAVCENGYCKQTDFGGFPSYPCDDGNPCSLEDHCVGDVCTAGDKTLDCDDENACTTDMCDSQKGCVYIDLICNDFNDATVDSCNPKFGCLFQ